MPSLDPRSVEFFSSPLQQRYMVDVEKRQLIDTQTGLPAPPEMQKQFAFSNESQPITTAVAETAFNMQPNVQQEKEAQPTERNMLEATPTPAVKVPDLEDTISPFQSPFGEPVQAPSFEPDEPTERQKQIADAAGVDPIVATTLSNIPEDPTLKVGSFTMNGQIFVFVDTLNIHVASSYAIKKLAYDYRYVVNCGNAGIETYGAPRLLEDGEKPQSSFIGTPFQGKQVFRAIFRLVPGL